jgi:hypothetical protein
MRILANDRRGRNADGAAGDPTGEVRNKIEPLPKDLKIQLAPNSLPPHLRDNVPAPAIPMAISERRVSIAKALPILRHVDCDSELCAGIRVVGGQ